MAHEIRLVMRVVTDKPVSSLARAKEVEQIFRETFPAGKKFPDEGREIEVLYSEIEILALEVER